MAAALGDQSVKVASIYTQLVPARAPKPRRLTSAPPLCVPSCWPRRPAWSKWAWRPTRGAFASTKATGVSRLLHCSSRCQHLARWSSATGALGRWYTIADDGGVFTGSGSGRIIYTIGSVEMTLPRQTMAAASSSSGVSRWATTTAAPKVRRCAPEYAWRLAHAGA